MNASSHRSIAARSNLRSVAPPSSYSKMPNPDYKSSSIKGNHYNTTNRYQQQQQTNNPYFQSINSSHKSSQNSNFEKTAVSLEKTKRKAFSIIEQLTRAKSAIACEVIQNGGNSIQYDMQDANTSSYQSKGGIRSAIDSILQDLNNEIYSISEKLQQLKRPSLHSAPLSALDKKKIKRRVKRLEEEAKIIIAKVSPNMNMSTQNFSNDQGMKSKNSQLHSSQVGHKFRTESQPPALTKNSNNHSSALNNHNNTMANDIMGNSISSNSRLTAATSLSYKSTLDQHKHLNSKQSSAKGSIRATRDTNKTPTACYTGFNLSNKSPLPGHRMQRIMNQEDETWQKLEDLMNVGSDKKMSIKQKEAANSQYNNNMSSLSPMKTNMRPKGKITLQNRTPNRLPNLYNQNVISEYGDTIPSNSGVFMIDKEELDIIRNQIKDVVSNNKEQQKQVLKKLDTIDDHTSTLEVQLQLVKEDQSRIINSYYDLESRYKDIIQENKQIKNEILDMRRDKNTVQAKINQQTNLNMPFYKEDIQTIDSNNSKGGQSLISYRQTMVTHSKQESNASQQPSKREYIAQPYKLEKLANPYGENKKQEYSRLPSFGGNAPTFTNKNSNSSSGGNGGEDLQSQSSEQNFIQFAQFL